MKTIKFKFGQRDYDYGINLSFSVDFIQCDDDPSKMECLQCTISNGCQSVDYADVIEQTTLLDVIKEFMREC